MEAGDEVEAVEDEEGAGDEEGVEAGDEEAILHLEHLEASSHSQ